MARAKWLGSAGRTALVRCTCGARLYFSLPHWRRRSFAACDECKAVIRYGSLEVVEPHQVEEFVNMVIAQEEERETLRAGVERALRHFIRVFDGQPEWLWSPATVKFVAAVRPKLELLGGPIGPMDAGRDYGASPESAYQGEEDVDEDELLDDDVDGELESDAA